MCGRNNPAFPFLFCLLLSACGSAPEKPNLLSGQVNTFSARGDAAFLQGEYERAGDNYRQALRISQSVENADGIAIMRFNLGRVYRETGNTEQAHQQLDALFSEPVLPYPPATLAAAAALKCQLYFEGRETAQALRWVEKGEALCRDNCAVAGSLLLLRARLAQQEGRFDEALKYTGDAASALNSGNQPIELANAHRLSGEIGIQMNDATRAIASLRQAYALDRKTGLPVKIRQDLLLLGMAHERAGEAGTARHFYFRALSVSEAMGNTKGADDIRARIKNLQGVPEDNPSGER